jgi:uncharacterized membrane protein YhfC
MLYATYVLAILIEVLLPFALGIWFIRKYGTSWRLFGVGVLTFIASQIVHFPLLYGISELAKNFFTNIPTGVLPFLNAVILGLAAGICEETARWVGFKLLKNRAKSFGAALTIGAGHGGVESFLVGLVVLANFVVLLFVSSGKGAMLGLPPETLAMMGPQIGALASMPWYTPLAGAAERIFTVTMHLSLSVMVWQAFIKRSWGWFIGAVLWHAFIDGVAVIMSSYQMNIWLIEGVLALIAVANLVFLIWFGRRQAELEIEDAEELEEAGEVESLEAGDSAAVEPTAPTDPDKEA